MINSEINKLLNEYCRLRDRQYAVYGRYARRYALTTNELFVLDILWFADDGVTQKDICDRLSANKQTVAAIVNRFMKKGLVVLEEAAQDRRHKLIRFTPSGVEYARKIIPPAARADNLAFAELDLYSARELVRRTADFTKIMEKKFEKIE